MKNKIIKVPRCTKEQIQSCTHPMSKRKWSDDEYVCEAIRPIDCPHLLCEGVPCLAGAVVNTNSDEVEFPCSGCKKPTESEKKESYRRFKEDLKI